MNITEIAHSNSTSVFCNGKDVPYDHPKIFLEIDQSRGTIDCPYCSKHFIFTTPDISAKKA